ncbi:uncharacterized protein V6R79_007743 [Siganus canaliculatus]
MFGYHHVSSGLTFLVLLTGPSFLHLATSSPINTLGDMNDYRKDTVSEFLMSGDEQGKDKGRRSVEKDGEEEDELFKDVDPKTLAAVLLEALNHSQVQRRREGGERVTVDDDLGAETGDLPMVKGADRDRDGREELELLMAAQVKEQEREEEDKIKKALEDEKMTEKVASHTTSQKIQVQAEYQPNVSDGENGQSAFSQWAPNSHEHSSNEKEEEEQLNPEELKNLETMMKEFPRLNTPAKREEESEQIQRQSRGYNSYNDIIPIKNSDVTIYKKKLKWQEETQKALNFPTFGQNFMDDFGDSNFADNNAIQSQPQLNEELVEDKDPPDEEEQGDEDVLSSEEEEAQAKAEQEEIRRQAAEAQRAKMKEERLADMAADMLLRYMVKQNNGNKKYSSTMSNAVEDKRSDEEQEVTEEDDIDPQTIDKLIEISNKLHLPADDVVDIISDVEKKKKKDVPPEMTSHRQQSLIPLSSSFSSANGFLLSQMLTNQNSFPKSEQPSPPVNNILKTWFQEKLPVNSKALWSRLSKPLSLGPKPQKMQTVTHDVWLKEPRSGYSFDPYTDPFYYQRKPIPDYYPIYFSPPPRSKPHYLRNTIGNVYNFPFQHHDHSWFQPRLRNMLPQRKPYYPIPLHDWTFHQIPINKPRSPPRVPVVPPQQKQLYYSAKAPLATRNYYSTENQPEISSRNKLEKYIQQILFKRPQVLD